MEHEILHSFKKKRKDKTFGLKLDMSEAYNRMECDFIKEVLKALGFHLKFIDIIMECISSVSYSVLLNGSPYGRIILTRGLRQGDPLSPYLFILGLEVFSQMLIRAKKVGELYSATIVKKMPKYFPSLFC